MTETITDPWPAFKAALPPKLARTLNDTQRAVGLVGRAVHHQGWTPQHLAAECARNLTDVYNPGGVITNRLEKAAEHPPVGSDTSTRRGCTGLAKRPFCSDDCRDRGGFIEDADGRPAGRCPCRTATTEATPR